MRKSSLKVFMAATIVVLLAIQSYEFRVIRSLEQKPDLSQNIQQVVEKVNDGVVLVVLPHSGQCSGSIIDSRGYILTAAHCVSDFLDLPLEVTIPGETTPIEARVVWQDQKQDLVVLRLTAVPDHLTILKIAKANPVPGEIVLKIGNGLGVNSISAGIVTRIALNTHDSQGPEYIQSDTLIKPGDSGSPLLNLKGEIVGVNDRILQQNPFLFAPLGISFSIDIPTIKEFLANAENFIAPSPEVVPCSID